MATEAMDLIMRAAKARLRARTAGARVLCLLGKPGCFCLNNFFLKNMIDLKSLDFLSYTYTLPIQLENLNIFHYSSVDKNPKWTEIGKKWFLGYKSYR